MLITPGFLEPEGSEDLADSKAASSGSWDGDSSCCSRVLEYSDSGTEKLLVWLWEASNEKCVGRTVLRVGWSAKPFTGQEQEL